MEQQNINLSDYLEIVIEKLNVCEIARLKAEGYTNECFFNLNGSLTEDYKIKLKEKQKYFYLNFGSSGAFMVLKQDITTKNGSFPKNSVFGIKGYGTPNFKKCYGDIFNLDIEKLHKLRYDYRR